MTRLNREVAFYDDAFADDHVKKETARYYAIAQENTEDYSHLIAESARPRQTCLEYGCGQGSAAFELAERQCLVAAIDVSHVGLVQASKESLRRGLHTRLQAIRMDGESLAFCENSFDLVCGSAILHHLDLDRAYSEIARVLRPNGRAVFMEPLGHNPIINAYRRRTPHLRTADEHPLTTSDLLLAGDYFGWVKVRYYHLCTLAAIPMVGTGLLPPILGGLAMLDRLIFRLVPPARRFAWYVVVVMSQPKVGARQ